MNQVIQSNTSVILVDGFDNLMNESDNDGMGIQPVLVVHDSTTMYVKIEYMHMVMEYYNKHFREYLKEKFAIDYKFDLFIGDDYWANTELGKTDEDGFINLKSSSFSIKKMLKHISQTHTYELHPDSDPISDDVQDGLTESMRGSFKNMSYSIDSKDKIKIKLKITGKL